LSKLLLEKGPGKHADVQALQAVLGAYFLQSKKRGLSGPVYRTDNQGIPAA